MGATQKTLKHMGLVVALTPAVFHAVPAYATFPIAITNSANMHFGTLVTGGSGGTVLIRPDGTRTLGGGVRAVNGAGLSQPALMTIIGSTGTPIELSMTATNFPLTNGAGDTMVVDDFNLVTNNGGVLETITLATTSETFNIGATLTVPSGPADGTYTGNFTINAKYP